MFNSLNDSPSIGQSRGASQRIVHFDVFVDRVSVENRLMVNRLIDALRTCVGDHFRVETIPIDENRELVEQSRIIVTPTFIRRFPGPERRAIGSGDPWEALLPTVPNDVLEDETEDREEVAVISADRYVESLIDGVLLLNEDGVIEDANEVSERLFNRPRKDLIGEHFFFPKPSNDPQAVSRVRVLASPDSVAEVKLLRTKRGDSHAWIVLLRDVTAFSEAEAKAVADVARRDAFLASLSHELRNPLAAMTNAVQLMQRWDSSEPNVDAVRGVISRQCQQMSRIIDDLLQFSHSWRGEVRIASEPIAVAEVISDVVNASQPHADAKGVELRLSSVDDSLFVSADSERLHQSIANITLNAIRYTPPGGSVTCRAVKKNKRILITVADTGIGIESDQLDAVFEPFFQVEPRSGQGMGIGLALVKRFVELMGGIVSVQSEGAGKGATFTIDLPQVHHLRNRQSDSTSTQKTQAHRIVLIDDSPDIINMLSALLEIEGHTVAAASNGIDGVALISDTQPDLALIDIGLPDIDGFEVARRVAALETVNSTRLVAVSGYGQEDDLKRCKAVGFDDHVLKPITLPKLREVIDETPIAPSRASKQ